ncbi:MAG: TspO/MBR family protein [Candidatus Altimarinota bacterium]
MVKTYKVVIPLLVFAAAVLGSVFTNMGLEDWYVNLQKPELTPPNSVFGPAWTIIYVCGALSALTFWGVFNISRMRHWVINGLYRFNLMLNVFWSYLFFAQRQVLAAFIEMNVLNLTTLSLIVLLWPVSKKASLLLLPYFGWVSFATYLTYGVWVMNG